MKTDMLCYRDAQRSIRQQYPEYNPEGYVFCQENGAPYEPRTYQDLFKRCVSGRGSRRPTFTLCVIPSRPGRWSRGWTR